MKTATALAFLMLYTSAAYADTANTPSPASFVAGTFVVFQDNFDTDNGGVGSLDYASFQNFNVSGGTVDLIGNGLFDVYPGNGLFVDLTGTDTAGRFETKLAFAPGIYKLTFGIGNNPNVPPVDVNSVMVTLGDTSNTYTRSGSVPLEYVTDLYTVSSSSTLVSRGFRIQISMTRG